LATFQNENLTQQAQIVIKVNGQGLDLQEHTCPYVTYLGSGSQNLLLTKFELSLSVKYKYSQ
jgi:hypothetical protein